jgi:hypothetical protein
MSFVDNEPTSKKHCSSDVFDILVDTSLSFVLGLSFLVVTGNPSIDLQSFALAPLMLFFNIDLGLVVDCDLPWLVEGCHVCVWHSLNILFNNFINHLLKIMLNVPNYLLKPIMLCFLNSKIFLFHIIVDDFEMCNGRFHDSFVDGVDFKDSNLDHESPKSSCEVLSIDVVLFVPTNDRFTTNLFLEIDKKKN